MTYSERASQSAKPEIAKRSAEHLAQPDGRLTGTNTEKAMLGFWTYIMTDTVLFASLFATFVVLHENTAGAPGASELFSLPFVLAETLILLTSSFTCGLGLLFARAQDKKKVLALFGITFLLGLVFLGLELNEFYNLASEGHGWGASAFLSAFFTLVGTHGLHITIGLLWMGVLLLQIWRGGLYEPAVKRLGMLALFWHFLDIIWIFIFSIVYLIGPLHP